MIAPFSKVLEFICFTTFAVFSPADMFRHNQRPFTGVLKYGCPFGDAVYGVKAHLQDTLQTPRFEAICKSTPNAIQFFFQMFERTAE